MKKFTKLITCLIAAISLFCSASFITPVFAMSECKDHKETAPKECAESICNCGCVSDEVKRASGCPNSNATEYDLTDSIQSIINSIILVLGTVAVAFIVYGGVQYMTAAGDAGKLKKAKDTILYACIGLIICALAFAIANFTINIVNNATATSENAEAYLTTHLG